MKFSEIKNRITGISCPVFGISWTPSDSEREIARRIVIFLEDRRVLYDPTDVEVPNHCIHSIIDIREYLTTELQTINENSELQSKVRMLRASCRKFMDTVSNLRDGDLNYSNWGYSQWVFIAALGELRGVFGITLAQISVSYGIDIEDSLASIIPQRDDI